MYEGTDRFLKDITVSDLVHRMQHYEICEGVSVEVPEAFHHVIPRRIDVCQGS